MTKSKNKIRVIYGKQKPKHLPNDAYYFDNELEMYVESNGYFRKRIMHYICKGTLRK